MPTVTRSAGGRLPPRSTSVFTNSAGGRGYGVGTRNGRDRIVPPSSSTEALIPPPPQSIASVVTTAPVCRVPAGRGIASNGHDHTDRQGPRRRARRPRPLRRSRPRRRARRRDRPRRRQRRRQVDPAADPRRASAAPEHGTVALSPPTATVGYLPQEPERRPGETVRAFLGRRTGVTAAQRALDAATEALADGAPGADDAYAAALERWLALGGADLDERADAGRRRPRPGVDLDQPMTALSGGQAARAGHGLAAAQPLRRLPARRADQRPRPRRAGPAGGVRRRPARRHRAWSATTASSSPAR